MDNITIADHLRQRARQLDRERGNLLRVRAYRRAAQTILELDEPLTALFEFGGRRALQSVPDIGPHIAKVIEGLIRTGQLPARNSTGSLNHPAAI